MNNAPDRKVNIIRKNFNSEPSDWFIKIPEPGEGREYKIENISVLTINGSGRYDKFIENNFIDKEDFIPYWGISNPNDTPTAIFDNYLKIFETRLGDSEILFIIEDDVKLLPGWRESIIKSMSQLPKEWDILSGNFSNLEKIIQIGQELIKPIGNISSMNFTIFHRRGIEKIKSNLELRKISPYNHIDRYCFSERLNLNCYGAWPMICREIPGYSFNRKMLTDSFKYLIEYQPYKYWFIDKPKWID